MCTNLKIRAGFCMKGSYIVTRGKQLFRFTSISVNFIEFKPSNGCILMYSQF